jgi:hypothetical protein
MVVAWNRSDIGEGTQGDQWWYPDFPAVLSEARKHSWGTGDLFPTYGMPSFGAASGCFTLLAGARSTRQKAIESFTRAKGG